jgi:hypothetical protein
MNTLGLLTIVQSIIDAKPGGFPDALVSGLRDFMFHLNDFRNDSLDVGGDVMVREKFVALTEILVQLFPKQTDAIKALQALGINKYSMAIQQLNRDATLADVEDAKANITIRRNLDRLFMAARVKLDSEATPANLGELISGTAKELGL